MVQSGLPAWTPARPDGEFIVRRIAPLLLVVFLVPWRPCAAGAWEGRGEFGFDFGGTRFDTNVTGADRLDLRGGYHVRRHFELEGALVEERTFGQSSRHALLVAGLSFRLGSK